MTGNGSPVQVVVRFSRIFYGCVYIEVTLQLREDINFVRSHTSSEAMVPVTRWDSCSCHLVAHNVEALQALRWSGSCSVCNDWQLGSNVIEIGSYEKGKAAWLQPYIIYVASLSRPQLMNNRLGGVPSTRNAPPPPSLIFGCKIECYLL